MPEYNHSRDWGQQGFSVDQARLRFDIFRVLTATLSDEKFSEICEPGKQDIIGMFHGEFLESEVEHGLISTAIGARTILDAWRRSGVSAEYECECGSLEKDLRSGSAAVPLTVREACNKIIHHEKARFDVDDPQHPSHVNPIMYLYGKQDKCEWRATLDIIEYARCVLAMTTYV